MFSIMNFKQNSLLLLLLILCVNFNGVLLRKFTQAHADTLDKWTDVGLKSAALANNNQDLDAAVNLITSLGQAIPYAGPLATLLSGILGFGAPSELSKVMDKLENMNEKLDRLDERINEVLSTIESTHTVVLFKLKLEHLTNLKLLYKRFTANPLNSTKADFRRECDSNYMLKFFRYIENEVSGATDLSLKTVMTKNYDLKAFNEWSNRIAAMLSEATFLHVTCVGASTDDQWSIDQILNGDKQIIRDVIKNVKNELHKGSKRIKRNFFSHAKREVYGFLRDYSSWGNSDFSTYVYNHLNSKYYWRKWGVFAWNGDTRTEYEHWISHGGSNAWYWHHEHNRCFLVGSVLRYPDVSLKSKIDDCHWNWYHGYYSGNYWDVTATGIHNYLNGCIGTNLDALAVVRFTHGLRGAGGGGFFENKEFPYYSSKRNPSDYSVIAIPKDSTPYTDGEVCDSNLGFCGGADIHCCENGQKCCND